MKANRIIIALVMLMAGMSSCQDWFDVSPKADVKAEDMFEAESGFRDILTGVYGLMIHENLYGRQLTFGYTDVLAQYYNQITTQEHEYIKTVDFKYNEPVDKAVIEKIWSTQYKAIANLNTLLAYIDKNRRFSVRMPSIGFIKEKLWLCVLSCISIYYVCTVLHRQSGRSIKLFLIWRSLPISLPAG